MNPGPRGGLTRAQLGVLAADSLPDRALARPPGLAPTPLAETLARCAAPDRPVGAGPDRTQVAGPP